jgi:diaphanous 1
VEAAVELVVTELGLSRNLPILGGGNFEYVLEEVWTEGSAERKMSSLILVLFYFC